MARKKKSTEEPQNTPNTNESDDTFGLPDLEYKPLDRDQAQSSGETSGSEETQSSESATESVQEEAQASEQPQSQPSSYSTYSSYSSEEEKSSMLPKVLGILLVLLLVGAGAWYFAYYKPQQAKEAEAARIATENKKKEEARLADLERLRQEAEQRIQDSINAIPKIGTIEALSERTGRYYVVIGSAIDDDLINDYAKKLSEKGVSSKIIPPFGKVKFFRIAVADGDSFAGAQETANSMKAEYGDAVWVLKY